MVAWTLVIAKGGEKQMLGVFCRERQQNLLRFDMEYEKKEEHQDSKFLAWATGRMEWPVTGIEKDAGEGVGDGVEGGKKLCFRLIKVESSLNIQVEMLRKWLDTEVGIQGRGLG